MDTLEILTCLNANNGTLDQWAKNYADYAGLDEEDARAQILEVFACAPPFLIAEFKKHPPRILFKGELEVPNE